MKEKKTKKSLGLVSLLRIIQKAIMADDTYFAEKLMGLLDEKVSIEVSKKDYNYIIERYA